MKRPVLRGRIGLRREIAILLPTSLLILAVLAIFTLLSARQGTERLLEDRRGEAIRLARAFASGPLRDAGELRRRLPGALAVAVVDRGGRLLAAGGDLPPTDPLAPLAGAPLRTAAAFGPGDPVGDRVVALAPAVDGSIVRVDLDAASLAAIRRGQRVLSAVVLGTTAATLVLVLAFVGHLLRPYEEMLARARELAEGDPGDGDETEFLVSMFDRAMLTLARQGPAASADERHEEDMAALGRTLVPSLESGLLLLDADGRVLAVNPVASELLGLAGVLPGAALAETLAGQPELAGFLADAVAAGRGVQRHEIRLRRDGEVRTVGLTVHPLRHGPQELASGAGGGRVRGYLVLFADLTDVQRLAGEARLAESLAHLGELSAGVAHELRNSLATLRGYLGLLVRSALPPTAVEYVAEMRSETEQLQRVVDDFLAFARPGTTRLEAVRVDALLQRAAADPALAATAIAIHVPEALRLAPPLVLGDRQLLGRAVRNLLENAAQAQRETAAAEPIEVSLDRSPEGLELRIEDRGAGIPEAVRARLFHPFATARAGGVGLGLALTHRIVVMHGGRIRLEDRQGGGTRASVLFPPDTLVTEGNEPPSSEDS